MFDDSSARRFVIQGSGGLLLRRLLLLLQQSSCSIRLLFLGDDCRGAAYMLHGLHELLLVEACRCRGRCLTALIYRMHIAKLQALATRLGEKGLSARLRHDYVAIRVPPIIELHLVLLFHLVDLVLLLVHYFG